MAAFEGWSEPVDRRCTGANPTVGLFRPSYRTVATIRGVRASDRHKAPARTATFYNVTLRA